ncbi:AraC family transcriptional regulator [Ketobacter sp.]|uniref:AraC family transcriptional regulator n=1 Tax=Ketobacter sp. TaxID=2083498 RepID=UPI0025BDCA46|nr:AraC family transcriptional regulator [Ketobacter sp.]
MTQRTVSASWLKNLCDMFVAEGVNVDSLLKEFGLRAKDLQDSDARYPSDYVGHLWDAAVLQTGNRHLGLRRELCDRYGGLHQVGFAMMACPTLLDALKILQNYLPVVSEEVSLSLEQDTDGCWVLLSLAKHHYAFRTRIEFSFLTTLMLCTWITRSNIVPLAQEWTFAAPADGSPYQQAFGCPQTFDQPENRILISREVLNAELPTVSATVCELHQNVLKEQMARMGFASIQYRVYTEILRSLRYGEPRLGEIADAMHMSDRTLQRKLKQEGLTYQDVLDQTRQELAEQYLANSSLSLMEVSQLLGFLDLSNFYRAAKRWFGLPPGKYRNQLGQQTIV